MMTKRFFSLQSMLLVLCGLMLALIGYKGVEISNKISAFNEAEQQYADKNLVEAESWYWKAKNNPSILYREDEIAARLEELTPITEMKAQLARFDQEGARAVAEKDFGTLLNLYAELSLFRNTYYTDTGPYREYYRQITQSIGVSEHYVTYFSSFKSQFYAEMKDNLSNASFDDESFKGLLLQIPSLFYGDQTKKMNELTAAFKDYDMKKYDVLAAGGRYDQLLADAKSTLGDYDSREMEAPWVLSKVEELVEALLKQTLDNENYSGFARYAKQYTVFTDELAPRSKAASYAKQQIAQLMKKARSLSAKGSFQEAIDLYVSLSQYQDTAEEVAKVRMAWTEAEPEPILPDLEGENQYMLVDGGTNAYRSKIYVAAADAENRIYFARMNEEGGIQVLSNSDIMTNPYVTSIAVEPSLSTRDSVILLVKAESIIRGSIYALFEVLDDRIDLVLWVEADGMEINPDGSLLVQNPTGAGEGQLAVYERTGSFYEFARVKKKVRDVASPDIASYPSETIRFVCTVTQPGVTETLAYSGDYGVMLRGNFDFSEGDAEIIGTFVEYADIIEYGEWISIPVIQVESYEPITILP